MIKSRVLTKSPVEVEPPLPYLARGRMYGDVYIVYDFVPGMDKQRMTIRLHSTAGDTKVGEAKTSNVADLIPYTDAVALENAP